ncbi:MAG: hypothetical protein NTY41_15395 [Proteobacteria bacterium]|nr:hypothetical protein [Pseudomonadota bacterium]
MVAVAMIGDQVGVPLVIDSAWFVAIARPAESGVEDVAVAQGASPTDAKDHVACATGLNFLFFRQLALTIRAGSLMASMGL